MFKFISLSLIVLCLLGCPKLIRQKKAAKEAPIYTYDSLEEEEQQSEENQALVYLKHFNFWKAAHGELESDVIDTAPRKRRIAYFDYCVGYMEAMSEFIPEDLKDDFLAIQTRYLNLQEALFAYRLRDSKVASLSRRLTMIRKRVNRQFTPRKIYPDFDFSVEPQYDE